MLVKHMPLPFFSYATFSDLTCQLLDEAFTWALIKIVRDRLPLSFLENTAIYYSLQPLNFYFYIGSFYESYSQKIAHILFSGV